MAMTADEKEYQNLLERRLTAAEDELVKFKTKAEEDAKSPFAEWAYAHAIIATGLIFTLIAVVVCAFIKYKSGFSKLPNVVIIGLLGFVPMAVWVWFLLDYANGLKKNSSSTETTPPATS